MKKLITFLLLTSIGYSQYCPALGPDQILPCGVGSTTLTADLSQCGPSGIGPKQTTDYVVSSIPYVAQTNTGTSISMTDDSQQGPFAIGFTFCFYGQTYSQFYIGSNGWISFSGGQPTTFISTPLPTMGALTPKNCIMGPWQDWHPGIGGQIKYQTVGVAPCRKLIVSWIGVPMFSCTGNQGTFHIVIEESTNIISNYIQSKPACTQWQGGTATEGIHNATGTAAVTVPGRNSTAWTATNDAWRWTPNGPTVAPVSTWYQVGNPVAIGTGLSITVTPPPGGAQYTCHFVYPICNAGFATCNNFSGLGPDTVLVIPGPPNLPAPTIIPFDPTCDGLCDGAISIIPNGGTGVQTISWNGSLTGFTPINLCAGIYNFTLTDAAGCTISSTTTLINPPVPTISPIIYSDTACYQSSNEIYSVIEQVGYTYQWSSLAPITLGQGTDSINVDWSTFPAGFIPNAVVVTGYNQNNCPSLPESIDLFILNVLPVINPIGPFCEYDGSVNLNAVPVGGIFSGIGVAGNDFYPSNAIGTNIINYEYTLSGCTFDTTTTVIVNPQPTLDSITPHNPFYQVCEGDSTVTLFTALSNLPGYNEWTFMGTTYQQDDISLSFDSPGMFPLSVVHYSNGCASPQQQTVITVARCPELLFYVPNSFTPDGNEHNNTFQPVFTNGFDPYDFHLEIYNRWGELIFESSNHTEYWDGTYNNTPCPVGSYAYKIQFGFKETDNDQVITGNINLIR
jgi:gliding motility-associated-like protein